MINFIKDLFKINQLRKANTHYQKGIEAILNESYKLGHITKDKVQLMCMEALQVPK